MTSIGFPHKIVLTREERKLICDIWPLYFTGEIYDLLAPKLPEGMEWDDPASISFCLSQEDWNRISYLSGMEDHCWPLFGQELRVKFQKLLELPF